MEFENLIPLIYGAVPYPHQIRNLDFTSDTGAIRFDWRDARYRVSKTLHVEEVGDGVLIGSDRAILMGKILSAHNDNAPAGRPGRGDQR